MFFFFFLGILFIAMKSCLLSKAIVKCFQLVHQVDSKVLSGDTKRELTVTADPPAPDSVFLSVTCTASLRGDVARRLSLLLLLF